MKKSLLLCVVLMCVQTMQAQKVGFWFDAGLKGGYGLSGLINSNIYDSGEVDPNLAYGSSIGGKFGVFYGLYNGLTIDVLYSKLNQESEYKVSTGPRVTQNISWTNIDIAPLYRYQGRGVYVELGPQFSLVSKVKDEHPGRADSDVSKLYNENYISGVFGFGGYLFNYETFTAMFGLRMGYGLTDAVNDDGKLVGIPAISTEYIKDASKTSAPAFVQVMIEANFGIGYFARTSCAERGAFFRF